METLSDSQIRYKEFRNTDFWKKLSEYKRSLVNKCERCNSEKLLQCHHKFYRANLYNTKIEDLEVLCFQCHRKEHNLPPFWANKKKIKDISYKQNNISSFYTITDANTEFSNSRSKRYKFIEDAEKECKSRINKGISGVYILKSIKYISAKPVDIEINSILLN